MTQPNMPDPPVHAVKFYERDDDLAEGVARYLGEALDSGGTAVVVATGDHRRAFQAALAERHDLDDLTANGRFLALDAASVLSTFMVEGRPDADLFRSVVGGMVAKAAATAAPVRVYGEMVAILWDKGKLSAAIELESLWNGLALDHDFDLFCGYRISAAADVAAARTVCGSHSHVIGPVPLPAIATTAVPTRVFVPTPEQAREVRRYVRTALQGCDADVIGRVEEVASAVFDCSLAFNSPAEISVSQEGSGAKMSVRHAAPTDVDLRTVAERADSWDVTRSRGGGNVVWAEIAARN